MFCQSIYVFAAFPNRTSFLQNQKFKNYSSPISPCDVDHMLDILALLEGEAHLKTRLTNMITIF